MSSGQRRDSRRERSLEMLGGFGCTGRRAHDRLHGRKGVLHPVVKLANKERLLGLGFLALGNIVRDADDGDQSLGLIVHRRITNVTAKGGAISSA